MNNVILITGSNGGIGKALAEYLLEHNHRNIAFHFRSSALEIKPLLKRFDLDPEKYIFHADLTSEKAVKDLRLAIENKLGLVSTLLNVAGLSTNAMSWKMTLEEFRKVIDNNLLSSFLCSREFIPFMRDQKWGRIVNFTSIVGQTGVIGASHYAAAKAGLIGLTKSLALELANKNITVNAVALGYFNYGLINDVSSELQTQIKARIPAGRFGLKEDIGALIKYLISPEASFMTGQVLGLNGGQN